MLFNTSCLNIIYEGLKIAAIKYPEKFGTGDAKDVMDALYEVSRYQAFGEKSRYQEFLANNACCYVVYEENGIYKDVLRIDILRRVQPNKKHPEIDDFTGGLMHILKHFSVDQKYLIYRSGEI